MKGIPIGDYITVRNFKPFVNGAKNSNGQQFLQIKLRKDIELVGFICLTVKRISARKYLVHEIVTKDNTVVYFEDEEDCVILTQDWYDIKLFSEAEEVIWYNDFLGEQVEWRMKGDY